MAQIDDFFMYENRVEGITDTDYQQAQPYVEAAHLRVRSGASEAPKQRTLRCETTSAGGFKLRNRNTIEFLGIWERLMNPNFNCAEFDIIKSQAGLNRFRLSAKEWTEKTMT